MNDLAANYEKILELLQNNEQNYLLSINISEYLIFIIIKQIILQYLGVHFGVKQRYFTIQHSIFY